MDKVWNREPELGCACNSSSVTLEGECTVLAWKGARELARKLGKGVFPPTRDLYWQYCGCHTIALSTVGSVQSCHTRRSPPQESDHWPLIWTLDFKQALYFQPKSDVTFVHHLSHACQAGNTSRQGDGSQQFLPALRGYTITADLWSCGHILPVLLCWLLC